MGKKGLTLIATVMMIIFASLAVSGVSVFIIQRLEGNDAEAKKIKAIYLAQAGVHRALYDYRANGAVTLGQTTVLPSQTFTLGADIVDLFLADADSVRVRQEAFEIDIKDVTASPTITIDKITISWQPSDATERLIAIDIDGTGAWSNAAGVNSGTEIDITDYLLNTADFKAAEFTFEGPPGGGKGKKPTIDMRDKTDFTLTFELIDSPSNVTKTVTYYKNPNSANRNFAKFSLKSTGEVNSIWRTLYVDYDVANSGTSYITRWDEIDEEQ